MRKPMVAGNWKMHGLRQAAQALLESIQRGASEFNSIDVVVFPSFVHLPLAERLLKNTSIAYGAQNLHIGKAGAFTGEISGPMLTDYGCDYVLVGHSERRNLFHESLSMVAAKFVAAREVALVPVLCVGESLVDHKQGRTESVIAEQLASVMTAVGIDGLRQAVIAYEPLWAIGTGLTATPEQAQSVHAFIRAQLAAQQPDVANAMRILYGGSVKADNAAGLFAMPDIDGALVGGASLDAVSFLAICQAATAQLERVRA